MIVRGGGSAAGTTDVRGGISARIQVGRFVFELGSPAGTLADPSEQPAPVPDELRLALAQPDPAPEPLARAAEAIGGAESATGRVERALELFTAVARGRVDQKLVLKEVDALLGALERADRDGRHRDALRLARALTSLLALLGRWVALVESLRVALRAARVLDSPSAIAWARHELGTLALGAEDASAATQDLDEALRLREDVGTDAEVEATRHNLRTLRRAFPQHGANGGHGLSPYVLALVGGLVALLVAGGVALALLRDGDDPTVADTTAPETEITESPDDPTEERSASFAFEADEPVRRFQCRLDGGAFAPCVSPANFPGPLAPGRHTFAVRGVDLARNRGEAATFEWTIEAGEGPAVSIRSGPDELTNDPRAEFAIEPGEAASLECSLDDAGFESCPTLVAFDVEEGDHAFAVRGVNSEGTAGAPASYRWTLDTTPPSVEITSFELTEPTTALIAFEPSEQVSQLDCSLAARSTADGAATPPPEPPCVSPVTYAGLESGTAYAFDVVATDAAGNVGEPARQAFKTESDNDVD